MAATMNYQCDINANQHWRIEGGGGGKGALPPPPLPPKIG